SHDVVKLTNDSAFFKVIFDIRQEQKLSNDSIYINVNIPRDNAFGENRFDYGLFFWYGMGNYLSSHTSMVFPKKKVTQGNTCDFSLYINDRSPNCSEGQKCYHRLSFKVFQNFNAVEGANYFTINISQFDQCFVDRLDVENDFIYFDGQNI